MERVSCAVGLGSNLGDRVRWLAFARRELGRIEGIYNLKFSSIYESAPLQASGPDFLNQIAVFETDLEPVDLISRLLEIERRAGRKSKGDNSSRTLDMDLLLYGDRIIKEQGLLVPHERMTERLFVLLPLIELMPSARHPQTGVLFARYAEKLAGTQKIELFSQ